jgi:hypothetical protein
VRNEERGRAGKQCLEERRPEAHVEDEQDDGGAKLDSNGNHIWSLRFGDASQQLNDGIAVDGAGNIILTGFFAGSIDFGGGQLVSMASRDMFVAKLNPDGQHVWSQGFGGLMEQHGRGVITDPMDHIWATGAFIGSINLGAGLLISADEYGVFLTELNP